MYLLGIDLRFYVLIPIVVYDSESSMILTFALNTE